MEFVQFHPTALHHPAMPRPLLSEALRGEGALLRDGHGDAFMRGEHPLADLAPRDVVARAIHARMRDEGSDHLWLDATMIDDFATHFPTIWNACRSVGLDPTREWLPGRAGRALPLGRRARRSRRRDDDGRACGRAARPRAAVCTARTGWRRTRCSTVSSSVRGSSPRSDGASAVPMPTGAMAELLANGATRDGAGSPARGRRANRSTPRQREAIEATMSSDVGVVRDADGLALAAKSLGALLDGAGDGPAFGAGVRSREPRRRRRRRSSPGATARLESRGSHTRADFPANDDARSAGDTCNREPIRRVSSRSANESRSRRS